MSLLKQFTPKNLLEEREKFFSDFSYNPQFIYDQPPDQTKLLKYGKPKKKYLDLAKTILKRTYRHRNERDLNMLEGKELTQKEVHKKAQAFLAMHKLDKRYSIVWSSSYVSRASIDKKTLKFRLPVDYRREGLVGALYHEIGTHALRRVNYEQQPWFLKKKKLGFANYLKTEEGLATIHSLIAHTYKSAYSSALRYVAVDAAQSGSFSEMWQLLEPYIENLDRRWRVCVRQKRGVTYTGQPGGFSKDLVYFEGMVDVWHWLKNHDFDPTLLYFGKHALEDVEKAFQMKPNYEPKLPSFFTLDRDEYAKLVSEIGKENLLSEFG